MTEEEVRTLVSVLVVSALLVGVVAGSLHLAARYPRYVADCKRKDELERMRRQIIALDRLARAAREMERMDKRGQLSHTIPEEAGRITISQRPQS